MDQITIALIEDTQIPSVVKVINDAYRYEATFKKDPTRVYEDSFRELVNSNAGRNYVATIPQGHPFFSDFPTLPSDGIIGHIFVEYRDTEGYFGMLAVHPALHGLGVGNLLLSHAEETMKKAGLKESTCDVVTPIPRLQGYYQRRGYQLTGEKKEWHSDNLKEEAWFLPMKKNLTSPPSTGSSETLN